MGLQYAFALQTKTNGTIAAGIRGDFANRTINVTGAHATDAGDPLLAENISNNVFALQAGIGWYNADGFAGLSVSNITGYDAAASDINSTHPEFNFQGAYRFALQHNWGCTPAANYVITNGQPSLLATQLHFDWKQTMQFGIGYRSNQNYMAHIGYTMKNTFTFGYAYDVSTQFSGTSAASSHELVFSWKIDRAKKEN